MKVMSLEHDPPDQRCYRTNNEMTETCLTDCGEQFRQWVCSFDAARVSEQVETKSTKSSKQTTTMMPARET